MKSEMSIRFAVEGVKWLHRISDYLELRSSGLGWRSYFTLHKKGSKNDCNNYRWESI